MDDDIFYLFVMMVLVFITIHMIPNATKFILMGLLCFVAYDHFKREKRAKNAAGGAATSTAMARSAGAPNYIPDDTVPISSNHMDAYDMPNLYPSNRNYLGMENGLPGNSFFPEDLSYNDIREANVLSDSNPNYSGYIGQYTPDFMYAPERNMMGIEPFEVSPTVPNGYSMDLPKLRQDNDILNAMSEQLDTYGGECPQDLDTLLSNKQKQRSDLNFQAVTGAVSATRNVFDRYLRGELDENEDRIWYETQSNTSNNVMFS
jgi:hypothetical protein